MEVYQSLHYALGFTTMAREPLDIYIEMDLKICNKDFSLLYFIGQVD
jgi:hypothetical protein